MKKPSIIYVVTTYWDRNDYEEVGSLSGAYLKNENAEKAAKDWEDEDPDHFATVREVTLFE